VHTPYIMQYYYSSIVKSNRIGSETDHLNYYATGASAPEYIIIIIGTHIIVDYVRVRLNIENNKLSPEQFSLEYQFFLFLHSSF